MQTIGVLLPLPFNDVFDYQAEDDIAVGDLVRVNFGREKHIGVVWKLGKSCNLDDKKIKPILEKLNFSPLSKELMRFVEFVSDYNLTLKGLVLKMVLSVRTQDEAEQTTTLYQWSGKTLADAKLKNSDARWRVINFFKDQLPITNYQLPFTRPEIMQAAGVTSSVIKTLIDAGILTPITITKKKEFHQPNTNHAVVKLTAEQQLAATNLIQKVNCGFSVTLLDGVTGSGKTEVYFEAVAEALKDHGQVLIMVPEIALTSQWLNRFERRFGVKPAVWHSGLSIRERLDNYQAINEGRAQVIIGARSSLFLPYPNLKLIVIDESHDHSYKQEEMGRYQGRDMAVVRAKLEGFPLILSTATPSLETTVNVEEGKFDSVKLTSRFATATLPEIRVIDLKKDKPKKYKSITNNEEFPSDGGVPARAGWVETSTNADASTHPVRLTPATPPTEGNNPSTTDHGHGSRTTNKPSYLAPTLVQAIEENLNKNEQTMLFLNRRGYAPLTICRDCGYRIQCPHCTAWMTEHRKAHKLVCHQCGHTMSLPKCCPDCKSEDGLTACGPGVERIAEEIKARFPSARIAIVSSDITSTLKDVSNIITQMEKGEVDILIGTQILAKGHHFPSLTLVGIIDADLGLMGSDLRASEQTFQLLSQVSGRAGRGDKKGIVYVQTLYPDNAVLKALINNDREQFLALEKKTRQMLKMPPFGKLAAIIVTGNTQDAAEKVAISLGKTAPNTDHIKTLGPAPAPVFMLRGKYRYRLLLKTTKTINIQAVIKQWLTMNNCPTNVRIEIDIDPYSFM